MAGRETVSSEGENQLRQSFNIAHVGRIVADLSDGMPRQSQNTLPAHVQGAYREGGKRLDAESYDVQEVVFDVFDVNLRCQGRWVQNIGNAIGEAGESVRTVF